MKVNISLPSFHGFYNSMWSEMANDSLRWEIEERGITKGDNWSCEWSDFQKNVADEYAESYLREVNCYLGLNVKKIGEAIVDSPKYYNYRTDRIYIDVKFSGIKKVYALMRKWENELRDIIRKNHTSCSGFISLMSNDFDEWISECLKYKYEDFGLYLSYVLYYLTGLERNSFEFDADFIDWICGNVSAEWYPNSEDAKEEYEKVLAVEDAYGFGTYNDARWGEMSVEGCRVKCEQHKFDEKYQLKLF